MSIMKIIADSSNQQKLNVIRMLNRSNFPPLGLKNQAKFPEACVMMEQFVIEDSAQIG